MFDVEVSWILDIFRSLFAFLDWIVYSVIAFLFKAVFNLANFELVGFYESFEERVYVILGIFMLFKVTISLITYLVNPDKITDKEQGVSKVVVRIITVLVMLIALPTFFDLMTEAQNKLLPVIPRVIVGTANTLSSEDAAGIADNMAVTMLQGFAHLKDGCEGVVIEKPMDILNNINTVCSSTNNTYSYDYLPVVSTIVGLAMCYVVFSLCISVAIRAFKLIILRMIAPVPVMSYIDPKSAKDGAFSHWTKTFISTWAELFINLGIIYFIVYIIDFILSGEAWKGFFDGITNPIDGVILLAFVIIGLLFFAKSAPQFVFDALGIKNKGGFMRMLSMGAAAAGIGGSIATGFKTRNEFDAANGKGSHGLRNFGASLFSGLAGGIEAGGAIMKGDKPSFKTGIDAQSKYNSQMLNRINSGSTLTGRTKSLLFGTTTGQTPADEYRMRNSTLDKVNKAFKDYKSAVDSRFDGDDGFAYAFEVKDRDGNIFSSGNKKINWILTERLYSAAASGDSAAKIQLAQSISDNVYDSDGNIDQNKINDVFSKFRDNYDSIHKKGYSAFAKEAASGNGDSVVYGKLRELQDAVKGVTVDVYDEHGKKSENNETVNLSSLATGDYVSAKKAMGSISGTQRDLVTDPKYKAAMADEKESKK